MRIIQQGFTSKTLIKSPRLIIFRLNGETTKIDIFIYEVQKT